MTGIKGLGRATFAVVYLLIGGILNVIYGIAAISNSHFFVRDTHYVFANLRAWGWVALILGAVELLAAASLASGRAFGRWFAILAASLVAISALLDLPAYPFWSLAIFALSLWIIHGLAIFGRTEQAAEMEARGAIDREARISREHAGVAASRATG